MLLVSCDEQMYVWRHAVVEPSWCSCTMPLFQQTATEACLWTCLPDFGAHLPDDLICRLQEAPLRVIGSEQIQAPQEPYMGC